MITYVHARARSVLLTGILIISIGIVDLATTVDSMPYTYGIVYIICNCNDDESNLM